MRKAHERDKEGWQGWYGYENIYKHDGSEPSFEVNEALQIQAEKNGSSAWVLVDGKPYGWIYVSGEYANGPYLSLHDYRNHNISKVVYL